MPFESKAQKRFMFSRHPRIAKRWAHEMKGKGQSIKSLPEKTALDGTLEPGKVSSSMDDTEQPKTAFDLAFYDEISKLAASRTDAVRAAQRVGRFASKRIRGVQRHWKSLGKKVRLRKGRQK